MTEIPTTTTYTLNELYTEEEVPLHFSDIELADILKGFEIPLVPIKEEVPKIEKPQIGELADIVKGFEIPLAPKIEIPQIGLPTIKRAYKKRTSVDTTQKPKDLMKKVRNREKIREEKLKDHLSIMKIKFRMILNIQKNNY